MGKKAKSNNSSPNPPVAETTPSKAQPRVQPRPSATQPAVAPAGPKTKVAQILNAGKLEYGPAPESGAAARQWLAAHNNKIGLFINGKNVMPDGRKTEQVFAPASGEKLADVVQAEAADVDCAVQAARAAATSWSQLPGATRARHVYNIARHIQKHHRLLAVLESLDNGKPIHETRDADVPLVARHFYYYAGWAQLMDTELKESQPVGVIAQVIPWNFPLLMLAWKIAPAIALGNTVVLKPAPYTNLTAFCFAELLVEAGLPPGVVNILPGDGPMGSLLCGHPDVDKVAFTGSTGVGRILRRLTAGTGKKISLELGGKSPICVFEDADLDSAIEGVITAIFFNQGQCCCAGSRLLVQESVYPRFMAKLKRRMNTFRITDSLDKCTDMSAIVDVCQLKRIEEYIDIARAEGCNVFQPDIPLPEGGLFMRPTLIENAQPVSTVVQEEIFGPVVVAMSFRTPDEAVKLANNTKYGLGASVWTENVNLALHIAIQIKAGNVWVNAHNLFDAAAGFGGYRESGYGREGGREGCHEYLRPAWQPRPRPQLPAKLTPVGEWSSNTPTGPPVLAPTTSLDPVPAKTIVQSPNSIDRTPKMYIGGKQVRPDGHYYRDIYDKVTHQVITQVGEGNRKDIRDAVEAAHKAAPGWGKRAAFNRAQICYYIAENLSARSDEFADRIVSQTGRTRESAIQEVEKSVERLFTWAAWADKYGGVVQETPFYGVTTQINEPVGVIGIACPTEYPLLGFVSLVAPAVVRANTVVVIPSEEAPLCATDLYQVLDTSDLPGGVVNIVTGARDHLVKTMAEHQAVDSVWYFGTSEGSFHVENLSADNIKRTWVDYGIARDWLSREQGEGEEFLVEATEVKNIWIPFGV